MIFFYPLSRDPLLNMNDMFAGSQTDPPEDEEDSYFDMSKCQPIRDLTLQIGSNLIKRYSCSAHKMNISIRKAIETNSHVSEMLLELASFSSSCHHSKDKSELHSIDKCKLRTQNLTRWSSSYLMLESFVKCFSIDGFFDSSYQCPIARQEIEKYLQILKPCYLFSLFVQRSDSTISQLIPLLGIVLSELQSFALEHEDSEFRSDLMANIKFKFKEEIKMPIYYVAALLDVAYYKAWSRMVFADSLIKKAIESIDEVFKNLILPLEISKQAEIRNKTNQQPTTNHQEGQNAGVSQFLMIASSGAAYLANKPNQLTEQSIFLKLSEEKREFLKYLQTINDEDPYTFISQSISQPVVSSEYWFRKKTELPYLYSLASCLFSIPISSAFIERFFSITGVISTQRRCNMATESLCDRSLLRSNSNFLEDLQINQGNEE